MFTFTYQTALRRALPCIHGPLDYRDQRALLERIDTILSTSGFEQEFIRLTLAERKINLWVVARMAQAEKKRKEDQEQKPAPPNKAAA